MSAIAKAQVAIAAKPAGTPVRAETLAEEIGCRPETANSVLAKLAQEKLVRRIRRGLYEVTNLGSRVVAPQRTPAEPSPPAPWWPIGETRAVTCTDLSSYRRGESVIGTLPDGTPVRVIKHK